MKKRPALRFSKESCLQLRKMLQIIRAVCPRLYMISEQRIWRFSKQKSHSIYKRHDSAVEIPAWACPKATLWIQIYFDNILNICWRWKSDISQSCFDRTKDQGYDYDIFLDTVITQRGIYHEEMRSPSIRERKWFPHFLHSSTVSCRFLV